jgi:hypothetical protein
MGEIADNIGDVLAGKASHDVLGPSWRADLSMPIYEKACKILAMPLELRRAAIEGHCDLVAGLLKAEVTRLNKLYKGRLQ